MSSKTLWRNAGNATLDTIDAQQHMGGLKVAGEQNILAIGAVCDPFEIASNAALTSIEWGFQEGTGRVATGRRINRIL